MLAQEAQCRIRHATQTLLIQSPGTRGAIANRGFVIASLSGIITGGHSWKYIMYCLNKLLLNVRWHHHDLASLPGVGSWQIVLSHFSFTIEFSHNKSHTNWSISHCISHLSDTKILHRIHQSIKIRSKIITDRTSGRFVLFFLVYNFPLKMLVTHFKLRKC